MSEFKITVPEGIATPFYYYDMPLLRATADAAAKAAANPAFRIHYAMKANNEGPVLETMLNAGFGIDAVSGGEVALAIDCGFDASKIVFAGVGKSDSEIRMALDAGIGCFNIESIEELEVIAEIAESEDKIAPVAVRVNPDIDAHTHHYITTGLKENKFGVSMDMLDRAIEIIRNSEWLNLIGLHFHIGSQITTMRPYEILCERVNALQDKYESRGIAFKTINLGGGLGIDYDNPDASPVPNFKGLFETVSRNLRIRAGQEVHFELGRSLVAQCGSLISKVLYVKRGLEKNFVIVDAGFTDLIRPAFYGAHHLIQNLTSKSEETETYDVVGPICESSDTFGQEEVLPVTRRGDLIAFRSAGAYGSVMSMGYNCRMLPGAYFYDVSR